MAFGISWFVVAGFLNVGVDIIFMDLGWLIKTD